MCLLFAPLLVGFAFVAGYLLGLWVAAGAPPAPGRRGRRQ